MTATTTTGPLLTHRPHGIEHPYATSADQRVPVLPEAGETICLGVIARDDVTGVTCQWQADGGPIVELALQTAAASAADTAALAGGDGHLAEA